MGEGTESSGKRQKKAMRNRSPLTNTDNMDGENSDKKLKKVERNKKRKGLELPEPETTEVVASTGQDDDNEGNSSQEMSDNKMNRLKKREKGKTKDDVCESVPQSNEDEDLSDLQLVSLVAVEAACLSLGVEVSSQFSSRLVGREWGKRSTHDADSEFTAAVREITSSIKTVAQTSMANLRMKSLDFLTRDFSHLSPSDQALFEKEKERIRKELKEGQNPRE